MSSDDDRNSPEADFLSQAILYAKHPAMTGSLLLFGGDGAGKVAIGRWWSEVWEDSRAEEFLDRIYKIYRIKKGAGA